MDGKRSDKVADLIQKEVSEMLVRNVKDPRIGFLTITRVSVTADCRLARIRYSVVGTPEERERSLQGLNSAKGYIRRELGRRMKLKYTPELLFEFDPSVEYAVHIGQIIHRLQEERGEKEEENED